MVVHGKERMGWKEKRVMEKRERLVVRKRKKTKEKKERPSKLSRTDVQIVRKLCVLGHFQAEIAAHFDVTQQLISAIYNRSKRVDVPDDPNVDISKFLQREPMVKLEEVLALLGLAPTAFKRRV
jgi:hypothetical protein